MTNSTIKNVRNTARNAGGKDASSRSKGDGFAKPDPAAWAKTLAEYEAAQVANAAGDMSSGWFATKLRVLQMSAPDLEALRQKLEILWKDSLIGDDDDIQAMRMVIGDLRRFEYLGASEGDNQPSTQETDASPVQQPSLDDDPDGKVFEMAAADATLIMKCVLRMIAGQDTSRYSRDFSSGFTKLSRLLEGAPWSLIWTIFQHASNMFVVKEDRGAQERALLATARDGMLLVVSSAQDAGASHIRAPALNRFTLSLAATLDIVRGR